MKLKLNRLVTLIASAAALWSVHLPSSASGYQGYVANVFGMNGSIFLYVNNGAFDGATSNCPTGAGVWYRIDPATAYGRSLIALATAAKLTNRLVYAAGDGACSVWPGFNTTESLAGLDLKG